MILQPDMPFIWGSGWTSPIYNDNRRILSYPDVRNYVKIEMAKNILEVYGEATVVAAVSTVAIPISSIVADSLGLPMIFVRATPKDHGLENLIEGKLRPGQKVVLVEDTISTGGSTLKAAEVVRDAGSDVLGVVSIFNFEFPMSVKRLRDADIHTISLTNYKTLIDAAIDIDYIHNSDAATLLEWREDPANCIPANKRQEL